MHRPWRNLTDAWERGDKRGRGKEEAKKGRREVRREGRKEGRQYHMIAMARPVTK